MNGFISNPVDALWEITMFSVLGGMIYLAVGALFLGAMRQSYRPACHKRWVWTLITIGWLLIAAQDILILTWNGIVSFGRWLNVRPGVCNTTKAHN